MTAAIVVAAGVVVGFLGVLWLLDQAVAAVRSYVGDFEWGTR